MKRQLQHIRRLFVRTRKYDATAARAVAPAHSDDDDDGGNRLSAAFIVVLVLHLVAIVGVFAFARIKDNRKTLAGPDSTASAKTTTKPAPAKPAAPVTATAPAPTATPAPARETLKVSQTGPRIHVVQAGETLTRIAVAYGVGVPDVLSANKLKGPEIKIGQSLTIPDAKQPPKAHLAADDAPLTPSKAPTAPAGDRKTPNAYVVKKGDTTAKIAREIGCTYEELIKLNRIKDPKKIQPGQVLKVPVKNG
jgi:LysM repeat protein